MKKWLRYGPVAASAVLYQLAYAPFHFWLLIFVALVPWLNDLRTADRRQAWRSGLVFGWIFWLAQMNWLIPFVARWTGSHFLAAIPWIALAGLLSLYFGGLALCLHSLMRNDRVWSVPFAWAAWEGLRSFLPPFAFPWGLAASPLSGHPELIQGAAVGEIFLVSAWVVLVNLFVAEIFRVENIRRVAHLGLASSAVALASWVQFGASERGQKIAVTAGQPGVDLAFNRPEVGRILAQEASRELLIAASANGSQLAVLPEAISDGNTAMFDQSPLPVLYGRIRDRYQSACVGGANASEICSDKTRLVMFGEFVPLRGILPLDRLFRLPGGDMLPGREPIVVPVGPVLAGPSLCFEGLFPDVARLHAERGATVIAIMSIDDWYVGTTAMDQLADSSVFRAVESGLPVIRSASQGVTQIVDRRGRVVTRAPFGQRVPLRGEITVGPSDAFAGRKWFVWLAGLIALAGVFWRPRVGP